MIGALLALLLAAQPAVSPAAYVVDGVTSTIASDERIGSRRAGLLCLSAGAIRMKDVLPNDRLDQREVVAEALEAAGLAVFASPTQAGRRAPERMRIKGTVRAAAFLLCDRGSRRNYSGEARLDVVWRVQGYDGGVEDFRRVSSVTRVIERRAGAPLGVIYRDLLADAARDLARRLGRDEMP